MIQKVSQNLSLVGILFSMIMSSLECCGWETLTERVQVDGIVNNDKRMLSSMQNTLIYFGI